MISSRKREDICRVAKAVDWPRQDSAILRREDEIGLWAEDKVAYNHLVTGAQLYLGRCCRKDEGMEVCGEAVVEANDCIRLKRLARSEFSIESIRRWRLTRDKKPSL